VSGTPTLLVVVEPPAAGDAAAAAAARVALAAEAARLAAALGAEVRVMSWPADPEVDFGVLAETVARVAAPVALVAVLIQDGDAGRLLAPLVARRLGTGAVLGCSDVQFAAPEGLTFVKPVYGGWLEQETRFADGFIPVATLDLAGVEPGEAAAAQAAAALAEAEVLTLPPPGSTAAPAGAAPRVRHLETLPPDARSVDLVHAKRIVAAGMGTADEKLLAAVHELADLLEGSVGATRPMVDEGRLPKERLVGQTGRTVTPELYVALGVSGSPHHVAGVRTADRVLSINRDVRAPIFQFSDVGYVADLEEVLPALVDKIKIWRDAPAGGA
jgi:electron transfer flavoprotein alpha subunit